MACCFGAFGANFFWVSVQALCCFSTNISGGIDELLRLDHGSFKVYSIYGALLMEISHFQSNFVAVLLVFLPDFLKKY